MKTSNTPAVYCLSLARSQNGKAIARYPYWCVARYVAGQTADGRLTWRRAEDLTPGYRSQAKAIRESGVHYARVLSGVRQHAPVTL